MCICLLCIVLSGCKDNNNNSIEFEHNEVMQALSDRSYAAKTFAAPLFAEHMTSQDISDYTIEQSSYGFYTSEIPDSVYVVGYLYSVNGSMEKYGYKIVVDENENCSVLEEGVEVAEFLFSGEETTEWQAYIANGYYARSAETKPVTDYE